MSVSSQDKSPAQGRFQVWKGVIAGIALAVAIAALATASGYAAAAAFDFWSQIHEPRAFAAGETEALLTGRVATSLFAFQIVTVVSVLLANARQRRISGTPFLSFAMPPGGIKTLGLAAVALIALATLFASAVFAFDPDALRNDLQPFSEMMNSRTWWLILIAAGIGAPLAEECLFRGLLFGVLRRSPFGFSGAALVTAVTWAALHANYSGYGLAAITLIGLYLAWLRERTGSLLTPIVCHSTYNSLIILLMAFAPGGPLATG
ncbi:MAG TPA: CPBP family intramembrane glutamic endopeptidase [Hyphomicrobium sp.]